MKLMKNNKPQKFNILLSKKVIKLEWNKLIKVDGGTVTH